MTNDLYDVWTDDWQIILKKVEKISNMAVRRRLLEKAKTYKMAPGQLTGGTRRDGIL